MVAPPKEVGGCVHARHEVTRVRHSRFTSAEGNGGFCRVEPPFNEVTTILHCIQSQCRVHEAIEKSVPRSCLPAKNKETRKSLVNCETTIDGLWMKLYPVRTPRTTPEEDLRKETKGSCHRQPLSRERLLKKAVFTASSQRNTKGTDDRHRERSAVCRCFDMSSSSSPTITGDGG